MPQDRDLQYAVLAEFEWQPGLSAAEIGVTAKDGVVTLTGHVATFAEKYAAEKAAGRVRGVMAVVEEIDVRLPFDNQRDDEAIAAAAIDRIGWDVVIPRDAVKVRVEAGWLTLTGEVDSQYQKTAAEREIRPLMGVAGLSNQITIKPRIDVANLGDAVLHALHRSWLFDPDKISVSASGGRIHLTGSVHSQHERQIAAVTAWSAPGTTSVQNDLAII